MDKFYKFQLPYGDIYLYGGNIEKCVPYINNAVSCLEDVCSYCSKHNLHIFHNPNRSIYGLFELIRVYRLTKKYGVRGTLKEVDQYLKSLGV